MTSLFCPPSPCGGRHGGDGAGTGRSRAPGEGVVAQALVDVVRVQRADAAAESRAARGRELGPRHKQRAE